MDAEVSDPGWAPLRPLRPTTTTCRRLTACAAKGADNTNDNRWLRSMSLHRPRPPARLQSPLPATGRSNPHHHLPRRPRDILVVARERRRGGVASGGLGLASSESPLRERRWGQAAFFRLCPFSSSLPVLSISLSGSPSLILSLFLACYRRHPRPPWTSGLCSSILHRRLSSCSSAAPFFLSLLSPSHSLTQVQHRRYYGRRCCRSHAPPWPLSRPDPTTPNVAAIVMPDRRPPRTAAGHDVLLEPQQGTAG